MRASKSTNTIDLAIVMPERDIKVEYEDWTTEILLSIQAYYAATAITKGYNEDQSSYNRAIKGPEIPLWK
jgi:hypothetical protein